MQERNLRVLEFNKILALLSELCVSDMGKQLALDLMPSGDVAEVTRLQTQTEEASMLLRAMGGSPMAYFTDVREYLRIAALGGTLSQKALLDVAEAMRASRVVRTAIIRDRDETPILIDLASRLSTHQELEEEIHNAILSEDEMSDRASPELYEIRRQKRILNDRVRDKLNGFLHNQSTQKYLQDSVITMRNGRYVVPIKAECRQFVPGLIHDQSASGATLFIEPMSVVEAGNDLKQWIAKEEKEIQRILAYFSGEIAPDAEFLSRNLLILAEIDLVFSKARLGREMNASTPLLNAEGRINIIKGRHPLIDPTKVVPISLWMGRDFIQLIITGPNTGGKTVTLKTVGLLTLMAQAGLQIPAKLGSELSVFDEVFADIGDEQSIEQSLSTFSSHMTNIVSILTNVTERSMALFDELGAGTDPTEGAALAMSILSHLRNLNVRTLATTHYSELKSYALSTPGIENASVEFDVETLRPTYRLSIGVPGKSNAFEISRKLGLSDELIADANERLSKDQIRFEDVIAGAEYHRQLAEKERTLAEQAHRETQMLKNQAEKMRAEIEAKRDAMLKKAKEEAKSVLLKAQRESEQLIEELKKSRKKDGVKLKEHEISNLKGKLQGDIDELTASLTQKRVGYSEPPKDLKLGETVEIINVGTKGSVLSLPDEKGEAVIQAGIMKMKVHISQLRRAELDADVRKKRSAVDVAPRAVALECDVRGMNLEEALTSVDLFLDTAIMQSLKSISIIHGKGTGVLRGGVQDYLKKHPGVVEYRLGKYGEGEDGVTIATLK